MNATMFVTVTCYLVARRDYGIHDFRVSLCYAAKHKESRLGSRIFKQFQNSIDVLRDSCRMATPVTSGDLIFERGNLKMLFDINGHRIQRIVAFQ
jgi:hypothetical protein